MTYCQRCGNAIADPEARYCTACGEMVSRMPAREVPYRRGSVVTFGSPQLPVAVQYASLGARFVAQLIDWIILGVFATIIAGTFGIFTWPTALLFPTPLFWTYFGTYFLLWAVLPLLYFTYFESTYGSGQTLGKRVMSLKVVDHSGTRTVGIDVALVRNVLRIIDFLPVFYLLGAIVIVSSSKKQRIGDMAPDTIVVKV